MLEISPKKIFIKKAVTVALLLGVTLAAYAFGPYSSRVQKQGLETPAATQFNPDLELYSVKEGVLNSFLTAPDTIKSIQTRGTDLFIIGTDAPAVKVCNSAAEDCKKTLVLLEKVLGPTRFTETTQSLVASASAEAAVAPTSASGQQRYAGAAE